MNLLLLILLATTINGLMAFVGALTLVLQSRTFKRLLNYLVAFSAGTLFAGALFHLAAEAIDEIGIQPAFYLVTVGFCFFFVLERYLWWHHCHEGECEVHPVSSLVLVGDGIHNFVDGAIIAASFLIDIKLGLVTTLLILLHEIPQELGDFAILIYAGISKKKALLYNFLSQITSVLGGLAAYFFANIVDWSVFLLAFAAGGFLYISASDLVPELHRDPDRTNSLKSFVLFLVGIALMVFMKLYFE